MIKNILNRFKTNKAKQEVLSNQLSLSKQQRALKTEEVVKLVEEVTLQENPNLINQTKTLSRLDILETFSLWSTTNINELSGQQKINTNDIATLKDIIDKVETKKADFILDTTDGQYKNVKSIVIDKATKADLLFDAKTQTYTTIDRVSVGKALLADSATNADYATTAGVANQIRYRNGVFHLDTIMSDYYTQDQIDRLLNNYKPKNFISGNNVQIQSNDDTTTISIPEDIRVNNVEAKDGNITIKSVNGDVLIEDNIGVISIRDLKTTQDNLIQEIRSKKPFTYKGEYVSTNTYQLNEIVSDKKKEFLSLQDNNTEPLTDKTAWVEFGLDGIDPEDFYNKKQIDSQINTINKQIGGINTSVTLKADKSYVDTQLVTKADKSYVDGLIKSKKVLLSSKSNYTTFIHNSMRSYRYEFENLGFDRSKFISSFLETDTSTFEDNTSYYVSFTWTTDNKLVVIITNPHTTDDIHKTYDAWNLVINYW